MLPETLAVFQTGVQYQFYHSRGLILVGIVAQHYQGSKLLFSGNLYAPSTTDIRSLGIITPIGGVVLIGAWRLLAFGA